MLLHGYEMPFENLLDISMAFGEIDHHLLEQVGRNIFGQGDDTLDDSFDAIRIARQVQAGNHTIRIAYDSFFFTFNLRVHGFLPLFYNGCRGSWRQSCTRSLITAVPTHITVSAPPQ